MARSHPDVEASDAAVSSRTRTRTQNKKGKEKRPSIAIPGEEESEDEAPDFVAFIEVDAEHIKNLDLNTLLRIAQQGQNTITGWTEHIVGLNQKIADINSQNSRLETENTNLTNQVTRQRIIIEHLEARRIAAPAPAAPIDAVAQHAVIKFKEPPVFDNVDDKVPWLYWKDQVEGKLVNLAQSTNQEKLHYVRSFLGGKPAIQVRPRFAHDAINPFRTVQDLFDELEPVYGDPDAKRTARQKYNRLYQKNTAFAEFYADFQAYANTAGIHDPDTLLEDLRSKLNTELKEKAVTLDGVTLAEFVRTCTIYDRRLQEVRNDRRRLAGGGNGGNKNTASESAAVRAPNRSAGSASRGNTPPTAPVTPGATERARPSYSDPAKQALSQAGKCFNCQQQGHIARDCPALKRAAKIGEITTVEDDSGNESP